MKIEKGSAAAYKKKVRWINLYLPNQITTVDKKIENTTGDVIWRVKQKLIFQTASNKL